MEERKIRGRSRRRKYRNRMRRPIAVCALMLTFSSFGTATAYADGAAVIKGCVVIAGTQEKVDLDKWREKKLEMTMKAEND